MSQLHPKGCKQGRQDEHSSTLATPPYELFPSCSESLSFQER